jgi:DNA-binding winged helix-turn-helix (wHTH) protein
MSELQDLQFLDFTLSQEAHSLTCAGSPVALEPQAFSILCYLVEHHQRVVTKEELLDTFWANKVVTEASISNEIRQVRKALGDSGRQQTLIRTVHGVGFQFIGRITKAPSPPSTPSRQKLPTSQSLCGRESEISVLGERLLSTDDSVLTLLGPGGIGKTSLAKAIVESVRERFQDGVWFVDLLKATDPLSVLEEIVTTLGISHALVETNIDESALALEIGRAISGKHCLIVLDNFEHVQNAAPLIATLKDASHVAILVTSRTRLSIRQETTIVLQGLSTDVKPSKLSDAATLFFNRAERYASLDPADPQVREKAEQICKRVGGTPLAIEMAATWLRYMPLPDLEVEITQSLQWLETDLVDVPERQRSTQTLFDSSWSMLTVREQRGLARLAIWPLGFTRSTFQNWGELNLRDVAHIERMGLASLSENGLYKIHELLRQLALEKSREEHYYQDTFQDFIALLDLKGRYYLHLCEFTPENVRERHTELKLLYQTFDQNLSWFIEQKRFDLIRLYFLLGYNAFQTARNRTRQVERYLPILKAHEPFEFYIAVSIEKLFSMVWQHHKNVDIAINQALDLSHELADQPKIYQARIAAIVSQMYRVNEKQDESIAWANKAIEYFALNDQDPKDMANSAATDLVCQSWCYSNQQDYKTALRFTDLAILEAYESNANAFWYGGFATRAWNLAYLDDQAGAYQQSALLFREACKRSLNEFLTIWTIQAAQTAELFQDEEAAADFLAFSEFFLKAFTSVDLIESRRTQEVISFMSRLEKALGAERFQQVLRRWDDEPATKVIEQTNRRFDQLIGDLPTDLKTVLQLIDSVNAKTGDADYFVSPHA